MNTPAVTRPDDLPRLELDHTPGFTFRYSPQDPAWTLFETTYLEFDTSFTIDLFEDGLLSWHLEAAGIAEQTPTVAGLYQMAERTTRLCTWLRDCATALAWCDAYANRYRTRLRDAKTSKEMNQ